MGVTWYTIGICTYVAYAETEYETWDTYMYTCNLVYSSRNIHQQRGVELQMYTGYSMMDDNMDVQKCTEFSQDGRHVWN